MQTVGFNSSVFLRSHESSIFETLEGARAEFIKLTFLGIPYRIPQDIDGKPTIKKATSRASLHTELIS